MNPDPVEDAPAPKDVLGLKVGSDPDELVPEAPKLTLDLVKDLAPKDVSKSDKALSTTM